MSNHRISIDTPVPGAAILDRIHGVADDTETLARIGEFIQAIAAGLVTAKLRWNANGVQAAGTLTFSSFADADTVTINGVVLTGKTSPAGTSQWAIGSTDQDCANNLVAKINASALDKIVGCVGASRRATILISSMVAGDTVTINGVVFLCAASPTGADRRQFQLGTSDAGTAESLKVAITDMAKSLPGSLDGVTVSRSTATLTLDFVGSITAAASAHATVTSTIVVVTALSPGQMGNLVTLAISAHGSAVAPSGGTEGTEVIFDRNYGLAV